jgi:hypothetical protein
LALILIGMMAAFWLFYAVIVVLGLIPYYAATPVRTWIMTGYALGISACLAGTAFLLYRRSRLGYFLSGLLLVTLAVLIIADQFGLPDLVMLLTVLLALGLIMKEHRWYLNQTG